MEIPVPLSRLSDTVADELAKAFGVEQVIAAAAAQSSPLIIDEVDRQVGRCLKDARETVIRDFYRREMRTRFGDDAEGAAWLAYAETASGKEVVTNLQAGIGAAMTQSRLDANHVLASLAKVQLPDQADARQFIARASRPMAVPPMAMKVRYMDAAADCYPRGSHNNAQEQIVSSVGDGAKEGAVAEAARQVQLDASYRQQIRERIMMTWKHDGSANGHHCTIKVRQLPGGDVLGSEIVEPCDLSAAHRLAFRESLTNLRLPYAGFERVFSRYLTVDLSWPAP